MSQHPLTIAIVGAGISGLASAYECAKRARHLGTPVRIRIFERNTLVGGNAQTRVFSLGTPYDDQKLPGTDYFRWADMGVNDINLTAYKRVAEVMRDIGYHNEAWTDPKRKRLLPLENTECYFTLDGNRAYTDDRDLAYGVSNPRLALNQIEGGVLPALSEIISKVALDIIYPPDGKFKPGEENLEITVEAFFQHLLENPLCAFKKYAEELRRNVDPNWQTTGLEKLKARVALLRDNQFYPRISAMYFANELGPEQMLLAAPFHYYCIQEGIGNEAAARRYFVGGSQLWIEYLADYLQTKMDEGSGLVDISLTLDAAVQVTVNTNNVTVNYLNRDKPDEVFDYAVMAAHADDALRALKFYPEEQKSSCAQRALRQQEIQVRKILESITYTQSVAVAHTFCGVLPQDRNAWRCYNVLIRQGVALKPYSMTYVCNRHQNDTQNPEYSRLGYPQFFVTLNPQVPIPDEYVLQQAPEDDIPPELHHIIPRATRLLAAQGSNTTSVERKKCVTTFKHNLLNKDCFIAQRELIDFHRSNTRLLLAGGWSLGAGLHEECFHQAERIAARIFPAQSHCAMSHHSESEMFDEA